MSIFEYEAPPRTVEETGLSQAFLTGLFTKVLYEGGTMTPPEIGQVVKLPRIVCRQVVTEMISLNLVESQGLESDDIKSEIRYSLTDSGHKWALEAMLSSQYIGPAPVPLETFSKQIKRQTIANEEIRHDDLERALSHLVIPSQMMAQLGPAANSGRSILLYGEPGNGKTAIAEALGQSFRDTIFIPFATIVGNQIIRFFDETLHELADLPEGSLPLDPRWVPCRRPVLSSGGELTLEMLDFSFEKTSRFYEAPMHLKALGGVFIIDDFGRQVATTQQFFNRWIVPLEKGFDIMSLHTGKKFTIPFDQLVIFSSNMLPEELGDGASLRRVFYKIHVPSPTREDYFQIFANACNVRNIEFKSDVVKAFFESEYEQPGVVTSGAHPGFLLQHIKAICRYLGRDFELTDELLQIAWKNVVKVKKHKISSSI
ncbi:P-loop NTPase family protein [Sulfitobacter sediminilitoris]|uniref:AAA family ATPase n=1 Tax=Sulfitobacter sediminilitoris TaxID=2698830 RepID=UPI0019549387|nr:AAA family ATPase [Sulfitobacter sediminilitoris]